MEMTIIPQAANAAIVVIPGATRGDPVVYASIHVYNGEMSVTVQDQYNSNKSKILADVTFKSDGTVVKFGKVV